MINLRAVAQVSEASFELRIRKIGPDAHAVQRAYTLEGDERARNTAIDVVPLT